MPKKHTIDAPNKLWHQVLLYKLNNRHKDINSTVLALIKEGLKAGGVKDV